MMKSSISNHKSSTMPPFLGPLVTWMLRTLGPLALRTTAGLVTSKLLSDYFDPDSELPPGFNHLTVDNPRLAERLGITIRRERVSRALFNNVFILCTLRDTIDYMLANQLLPRGARTWASHKSRSLGYILRSVRLPDLAVDPKTAPPQHFLSDSQTQTAIQMLGFFPEAKSAYILYWRHKNAADAEKKLLSVYVALLRNLLTEKYHEADNWRYYGLLASRGVDWLESDFDNIADMMESGLGADDHGVAYSSMYSKLLATMDPVKAKYAVDAAAIAFTITDLACGVVWSPGLVSTSSGLLPSFSPSNSFMVKTVLNTAPSFSAATASGARTVIEDKNYSTKGTEQGMIKVRKGSVINIKTRTDGYDRTSED